MNDAFLIENLIEKYKKGIPGRAFQLKMAAYKLRGGLMDAPPTAKKAGVLMLLFPKQNEWHVLLTERTTRNTNDRHSGQISFPGGQFELNDIDLRNCALREAYEECGILQDNVEVIGGMTDLYIPVSNFHVFPFLAWTNDPPQYQRQETEVKEIIEAPLSHIMHPDNLKVKDIRINENLLLEGVPYFDVFGKVVWGATAMMLAELMELIKA